MLVTAIPEYRYTTQYLNNRNHNNVVSINTKAPVVRQNVLPLKSYYPHPSFLGAMRVVKDLEKTSLYKQFVKSGKSYFGFIKDTNAKPRQIAEFLFGVTKDEKSAKSFIEEITKNPRKADTNTSILLDKMGSVNSFKEWYYHKYGYQRAYERYFKKEIFENDSVSVDDMVKISPNLMIDALKLKSLKTTGSQDFVIGKIPEEIGTIDDFRALTQKVRESQLVKEFIEFRNFMEDVEAFSAKYPEAKKMAINPARFAKDFLKSKITAYLKASTPEEKAALEKQVPFLRLMGPTTIEVNGKNYKYSPILRPYSTKMLFALDPEGAKNRYFVTMEMFNDLEKTCQNVVNKENSAMRSDSPYLNAVVDYYLKSNGCKNVPDMKFYDYGSNAVVYPFIKGEHLKPKSRMDDYGVIFEDTALKKELKPLAKLGVYITDCFNENFMKDANTGEILIVDNGHAKYSNALRPGVKMIHMGFSDLYGRDFVSLDAALSRASHLKDKA